MQHGEDNGGGGGGGEHEGGGGGGMGPPYSDAREHMARKHHAQTLWIYATLVLLGVWMLVAPLTFGGGEPIAQPSGGRELWLSDAARVAAARWSAIISGALLVVFGWRSMRPGRPISLWICCGVGVWLSFGPLLLWAPSAFAYVNDTLVGTLVIALTILVPGMPSMIRYMKMGDATPPGWSYNPSSWAQRSILIALGFAGWLVSRYLAAYQLGYIDEVWDPFFGDAATRKVLDSDMSKSLPISDAGLGAFAYTFEFLMGFMGSPSRWRTMPWMVTLFGILVIPLGLVHIALVISQPVVVGEWCTMCLLAAAIMLPMIPLEVDEVIAMGQHLRGSGSRGESLWKVFWKGGAAEGTTEDERSPAISELAAHPGRIGKASLWGVSAPWSLIAASVVAIWCMASPGALGFTGTAADVAHLGGAMALTIAVVAMSEPLRAGRFLNVLAGLALAILPWLGDADTAARVSLGVSGLVIAALAWPRGPIYERFGTWQRLIK